MKFKGDPNITGGKAAANGSGPLWHFLPDNDGTFLAPFADDLSNLYFPLMNEYGMKCSITPGLKGDIASSFQNYLTAATVTEELHRNVSSRNFWVKIKGHEPWSVSGNSVFQKSKKWGPVEDISEVEGKPGIFISRRRNEELGIESEVKVFVPHTDHYIELMIVMIKNISDKKISIRPFAATPLFGRHADNFRDHRQVTTMFQQVFVEDHGVRIRPTIVHDEHGHSENLTNYCVLGYGENGETPDCIWPNLHDFIGQGGSLDNPEAVYHDLRSPKYFKGENHGKEAIGAFSFKEKELNPGEESSFIILHGITDEPKDIKNWESGFGSLKQASKHLNLTEVYWDKISSEIDIQSGNSDFNNWTKWIGYQIKCRQIFGNSFLPDFGYGRGGRGWRDLWQDLLSIFLIDPESAKDEIINSIKGVRIDGSNATIIGEEPGTFVADRNKVPRTWCDHGTWPVFVINFYIQQTGDLDILFREVPFWKDQFTHRSKKRDELYSETQGCWQKQSNGEEYQSSILEHLIIQQLSAFYNVGDHNILLLEGGDWNDTYDMAREHGESTGFYAFYGQNLRIIASWLSELYNRGSKHIHLLEEITSLLNSNERSSLYSAELKQKRLQTYFDNVSHDVSGEKVKLGLQTLILDLILKADHIAEVVREEEWVQLDADKGLFNGHYDNRGNAVDGKIGADVRMDLTTQVMTVMHDIATKDQILHMVNAADRYLKNGLGYRLCTPFKEIDMNIGRITGFIYGHKEHGSKWMQQNIMLAYGLFGRGLKKQANKIIDEVFELSNKSEVSRIFPGVPSYFGPDDKGSYAYLTGSSAWLLLTIVAQMFGVRGQMGDLCLEPKLDKNYFDIQGEAAISFTFRGIRIRLVYKVQQPSEFNGYKITKTLLNGKEIEVAAEINGKYVLNFQDLNNMCHSGLNQMLVYLKTN